MITMDAICLGFVFAPFLGVFISMVATWVEKRQLIFVVLLGLMVFLLLGFGLDWSIAVFYLTGIVFNLGFLGFGTR